MNIWKKDKFIVNEDEEIKASGLDADDFKRRKKAWNLRNEGKSWKEVAAIAGFKNATSAQSSTLWFCRNVEGYPYPKRVAEPPTTRQWSISEKSA